MVGGGRPELVLTREMQARRSRVVYVERQFFARWVYAMCLVSVVVLAGLIVGLRSGWWGDSQTPLPGLAGGMAVCLFVMSCLCMTTEVHSDKVYLYFGMFLPVFWRHIPLHRISAARPVTYRPLRDAGGWGLRFGSFEGRGVTYYTARGNRGVLIDTGKRPIVIGSQQPEALAAAITDARMPLPV